MGSLLHRLASQGCRVRFLLYIDFSCLSCFSCVFVQRTFRGGTPVFSAANQREPLAPVLPPRGRFFFDYLPRFWHW